MHKDAREHKFSWELAVKSLSDSHTREAPPTFAVASNIEDLPAH